MDLCCVSVFGKKNDKYSKNRRKRNDMFAFNHRVLTRKLL